METGGSDARWFCVLEGSGLGTLICRAPGSRDTPGCRRGRALPRPKYRQKVERQVAGGIRTLLTVIPVPRNQALLMIAHSGNHVSHGIRNPVARGLRT